MTTIPNSINPTDPSIEDVNKSTDAYLLKNDKILIFVYGILVIGSIAGIIFASLNIQLLFIPVIIGFIGYGHVQGKIKREFTQQFGASIGFVYTPTADMTTVSGKLFKVGHSQRIYDVLSGVDTSRASRMFSYRFTVGYGKNSHTYTFTVFEATFSNVMPDIVLTSRTGMFFSSLTLFDSSEHVQLEGDFNKYFTLKVPKGYEIEAYQIFPPNVMADLIDRASGLDFEFNGNKLYIYATRLITVREKLQAMFDLAEYLDNLFARSARAVNVTPVSGVQS
jgi:hypothetical protein